MVPISGHTAIKSRYSSTYFEIFRVRNNYIKKPDARDRNMHFRDTTNKYRCH